jgi:hypothetical protein
MPQQVVTGAMAACSFGTAPGSLNILPANRVNANKVPAANIMDNKPMMNVAPFAMCMSPSNPQVAAATAAASGVLTPQPCIPNIVAPWTPGSATVMIGGMPALTNVCTLNCMWGGLITISNAGQVTVNAA